MKLLLIAAVVVLVFAFGEVHGCNEAVCASLVSKCQLIKSCECDMSDKKNCSCCNNCQLCLAQLYSECCSCVGMCPLPDPEDSILHTSTIEILPDPIPELFNVLTQEEDYLLRWTTHRYPVFFDSLYSKSVNQGSAEKTSTEFSQSHTSGGPVSLYNCTVAFMSECKSLSQCKQSCKSMGSAKYRWFHEGCCQCIGESCIDYGLNDAKCLNCREDEDEEDGDNNGKKKHRTDGAKDDDLAFKDVEMNEGVIDGKLN